MLGWFQALQRRSAPLRGAARDAAPRWMHRAPAAAALVLGIAVAVAATSWTLTLSARRVPPEPVQAIVVGNLASLTQPHDTTPLARLFGAPLEAAGANIRLLGVIGVGTQGRGIALLSVDGRPARAERAGKSIAPGLTLVEVRPDRVIVNRAGAMQEVRLPPKSTAATAAPAPQRAPAAVPQAAVPAPGSNAPDDPGGESMKPRMIGPSGRGRGI
jgi:general secretion pathway protein C